MRLGLHPESGRRSLDGVGMDLVSQSSRTQRDESGHLASQSWKWMVKGQVMGEDVLLSPGHCRVPLGRKRRPHTGWGDHPSWLCLPPVPPSNQQVHLEVGGVAEAPPSLHPDCSTQRSYRLAPAPSPASLCSPTQGSRPHGNLAPVTTQKGWPGLRLVDTERDAPYTRTWVLTGCLATEKRAARGREAGGKQGS